MSSTANHKKAIAIFREASKVRRGLMDIFLQIIEDCPSAIVNADEALRGAARDKASNYYKAWQVKEYTCPECKKNVSALGLGGACGICDPRGMDSSAPY